MKKTVITLMATAALAGAVVAPVVAVKANDVFNTPNTKVDYKVEELGLAVSTAKAKYDLAKLAHEEAGLNVTGRQYTLAATKQDLADAQAALQAEKDLKAAIQAEYDRDLGLVNAGTLVEGFNDLSAVKAHYDGLIKAQDAAIAAAEGVVVTRQTAVEVAQADLNEYVALQDAAYAALAAAKAELDAAIAAALAGGLTEEQVKQAEAGAPVQAPAGQNAGTSGSTKSEATSVKAANTATSSKALPKTSAAK